MGWFSNKDQPEWIDEEIKCPKCRLTVDLLNYTNIKECEIEGKKLGIKKGSVTCYQIECPSCSNEINFAFTYSSFIRHENLIFCTYTVYIEFVSEQRSNFRIINIYNGENLVKQT